MLFAQPQMFYSDYDKTAAVFLEGGVKLRQFSPVSTYSVNIL